MVKELSTEGNQIIVPNTVEFNTNKIDNFNNGKYNSWSKAINEKSNRKYLIKQGHETAIKFLKNKN